ncbi:MAG: aminomethyl-transferring glycine dehydrogenase subunit GcvPB [Thermomicrobiales bacterium]|nr:aminomethyl-transferring glycine dehydrogenase subunit GcvPB [Thermomicrobiales bacterium]
MAVEPLIFELSKPGRRGTTVPAVDVPETEIPADLCRDELALPEVSEIDVIRHFTRMSQKNHAIDINFYPLGSCTMKYNSKINEIAARMPGFAAIHPLQEPETVQGALELMDELRSYLAEISGFETVTLQPAAGAHGELTGVLVARAYHASRGDHERDTVLVPDSAHGTNPATAAMAGFKVVTVPSDDRGNCDVEKLKELVGPNTALLMITNPNTLGLWDENVREIVDAVHNAGGLVYNDGANFNAILGMVRPGDLGMDIMHFNLHKTFSTPHGGGGPGSGPVGVRAGLEQFLPDPIVVKNDDGSYGFESPEHSVGKVHGFYGNFGMHVRAYTYIRMHGAEGLRRISEDAVLAANYLMANLKDRYEVAYDRPCMHEFVATARHQKAEYGVRTLDIAKRLLDFGIHPPTTYFPLIVEEALMIEPTETESIETLDEFIAAMRQIDDEIKADAEFVKHAPHTTEYKRLDEVRANRELNLRWTPENAPEMERAAAD